MADYTKLSALVNKTFTVQKSFGYKWKKWDKEKGAMLVEDRYVPGFRKVYTISTDKGYLDLGAGQLGNLLEAIFKNGVSELLDSTFEVKSNGKTGMDIRYYFKPTEPTDEVHTFNDEDKVTLDDIPE